MSFFDRSLNVIENIGYIQTIIALAIIIIGAWGILSGIFPVLIRLGKGLAKRKIVIFAKGDNQKSLKNLLLDSKLFKEKNIIEITSAKDLGRAEEATVLLVFWHDWKDEFDKLLPKKKDNTALIIYAPTNLGNIPPQRMCEFDECRNVTVTNFRGRLLNDIVISMITTSY